MNNNILQKIIHFDLFLINYIFDFTDSGMKVVYDNSMNVFDVRINLFSPKFYPIIDLFSNRIHFNETKLDFVLFGQSLVYYSTEIIIHSKKPVSDVIRLYYIDVYNDTFRIPIFSS